MAGRCRFSRTGSAGTRCHVAIALFLVLGFLLGAAWAARSIVPPGRATERQVQEAIREMTQLMEEAGRNQREIELVIHQLRCKYTNPKPEGCPDVDDPSRQNEETESEGFEPGGMEAIRPAPRGRDRGGDDPSGRRR